MVSLYQYMAIGLCYDISLMLMILLISLCISVLDKQPYWSQFENNTYLIDMKFIISYLRKYILILAGVLYYVGTREATSAMKPSSTEKN